MKLLTRSLALVLTGMFTLIISCNKDEFNPILRTDTNQLTLPAVGGQDSFFITANVQWSLSNLPGWLTINPMSGSSDANIKVTYAPNFSVDDRTASLTLKANGADSTIIQVIQEGYGPYVESDKTTLNEKAPATTDSIVVRATVPWKITIPADAGWLSANKLSDTAGTYTVRFTIAANTLDVPRTTTVTLSDLASVVTPVPIVVNQEQPDVIIYGFTPPNAPGGAPVRIGGSGFSTTIATNKVKINGVNAVVNNADKTNLWVTVPVGCGTGKIIVEVNTKKDTSDTEFQYDWIAEVTEFVGGIEGDQDGVGLNAKINGPTGLDFDSQGNLYVADYQNLKVRKITPAGVVTTMPGRFAENTPDVTKFGLPAGIAVDDSDNIYVAEVNSSAVSKISNTGVVTMLAGGNAPGDVDGTGTGASFYNPTAVEADAAGNIYVSDSRNNKLRKITPAGVVTTVFPGNQFKFPFGLRFDNNGNLILCDSWNSKLLRITPAGIVITIAASGIPDYFAQVGEPQAVTVDGNNNIYFTDGNNKIHWILPSGQLRTATPNETVNLMQGIAIDKNGVIYASDYYNDRIVKITIK